MRRMNEVFALPITGENLSGTIRSGMTDTNEESAIAHAINHVDSLADALESMIMLAWLISEDLESEFNQRTSVIKAKAALAAYRGDR